MITMLLSPYKIAYIELQTIYMMCDFDFELKLLRSKDLIDILL